MWIQAVGKAATRQRLRGPRPERPCGGAELVDPNAQAARRDGKASRGRNGGPSLGEKRRECERATAGCEK